MSRIAVFADTHGNKKMVEDALMRNGAFDLLVHLGDGVDDGLNVAADMGLPVVAVQGNEDHAHRLTLPAEIVFEFSVWRFFAVHGCQMEINAYDPESLWQKHCEEMAHWAKKKGAQVFLFGHSHQPMLREVDGIVLCNPGDQYLGSRSAPTFAVIDAAESYLDIRIMRGLQEGAQRWTCVDTLLHQTL